MSDIDEARRHLQTAAGTGAQPDQATHALIAVAHTLLAIHLELQNLVALGRKLPNP